MPGTAGTPTSHPTCVVTAIDLHYNACACAAVCRSAWSTRGRVNGLAQWRGGHTASPDPCPSGATAGGMRFKAARHTFTAARHTFGAARQTFGAARHTFGAAQHTFRAARHSCGTARHTCRAAPIVVSASRQLGTPSLQLGTPLEQLGTPSEQLGTPLEQLSTPSEQLGTARHTCRAAPPPLPPRRRCSMAMRRPRSRCPRLCVD